MKFLIALLLLVATAQAEPVFTDKERATIDNAIRLTSGYKLKLTHYSKLDNMNKLGKWLITTSVYRQSMKQYTAVKHIIVKQNDKFDIAKQNKLNGLFLQMQYLYFKLKPAKNILVPHNYIYNVWRYTDTTQQIAKLL